MQDYNSALEKSIRQLARKCHAIFKLSKRR